MDLRMKLHPLYGDIRPVKDIEAIKNSIKNIILTNRGEKPFNPAFGSNISSYLFEPADAITKRNLGAEIRDSIQQWEPRVKLDEIIVSFDEDRNAFNVTILATIVNSERSIEVDLVLSRIR